MSYRLRQRSRRKKRRKMKVTENQKKTLCEHPELTENRCKGQEVVNLPNSLSLPLKVSPSIELRIESNFEQIRSGSLLVRLRLWISSSCRFGFGLSRCSCHDPQI